MRFVLIFLVALVTASGFLENAAAQRQIGDFGVEASDVSCRGDRIEAIVWSGVDSLMTIEQLASYVGPILWFSPDEPLLGVERGKAIDIPTAVPFEEQADGPVVYYRVRRVLAVDGAQETAYQHSDEQRSDSVINLAQTAVIDLDFFFYYPMEEGLGRHKHDVESLELQLFVWPRPECVENPIQLVVSRVVGKAHGLLWYDNTLLVDEFTEFPISVLVEEGKHASCTDKNGDGYFTPGYDVNRRVNDAWGVRDVLRTGSLFSGGYQAWMAKVRHPEDRVFPPLPEDSPLRERHVEDGIYAPDNAIYELRPFPSAARAEEDLVPFIADKGPEDWPELSTGKNLDEVFDFMDGETFVKSLSVAYRNDGSQGVSFIFPLFIVKNFEDPLAGGYVLHRVYLQDKELRDVGWTALYTLSASRWFDGYMSAGYEWDVVDLPDGGTETDGDFVLETGVKFRANISHSPFSFLGKLTDFWGLRLGVKYRGFWEIDELSYVLEVGAGTW